MRVLKKNHLLNLSDMFITLTGCPAAWLFRKIENSRLEKQEKYELSFKKMVFYGQR